MKKSAEKAVAAWNKIKETSVRRYTLWIMSIITMSSAIACMFMAIYWLVSIAYVDVYRWQELLIRTSFSLAFFALSQWHIPAMRRLQKMILQTHNPESDVQQ